MGSTMYLNDDMSQTMKAQVKKLLDKTYEQSRVVNITFLFTSPLQPKIKVYLSREIDTFEIEQDFISNYTDKITGTIKVGNDPFESLYYMRKNLFCRVQMTEINPTRTIETLCPKTPPSYTGMFKCTLTDIDEQFKTFQERMRRIKSEERRATIDDQKEFTLHFELLEDDVYKARKKQVHLIGRNVDMDSMIRYVVTEFGFTKAMIVKPDNKFKYHNLVIPPAYGIENIMSFLQNSDGLGVYSDGFCSYITDGCWYVYPRFGAPVARYPTQVYSVGVNKYGGLNKNDWYCGCSKTTHILCNSGLEETNWMNYGSENESTAVCAQISDGILDATRKLIEDDKFEIVSRASYHGVIPHDPMDMKNFIKAKFIKSHSNLYAIRSKLRSFQGFTYKFSWQHAKPWTFKPGLIVCINYDDNSVYKTIKGICEAVTYTFKKDPNPIMPLFSCVADVAVNSSTMGCCCCNK